MQAISNVLPVAVQEYQEDAMHSGHHICNIVHE